MPARYRIRLPWRNAALAVALTVALWGLPWLLWQSCLPLAGRVAHRAVRMPAIRFVRASPGLGGTAWSPEMFPLPTTFGFSGTVGLKGVGQNLAGVLRRHTEAPPFLPYSPDPEPLAAGAMPLASEASTYTPEAVEPRAYMLVHSNRFEGYHAEWYEGLRTRGFRAPALEKLGPPDGGVGWLTVGAWVELDAAGRADHVFLEQSSGQTNVDAAVIRALRTGRAEAGSGRAAGRARVFYTAPGTPGTGQDR